MEKAQSNYKNLVSELSNLITYLSNGVPVVDNERQEYTRANKVEYFESIMFGVVGRTIFVSYQINDSQRGKNKYYFHHK
jgi:hypothetical protein